MPPPVTLAEGWTLTVWYEWKKSRISFETEATMPRAGICLHNSSMVKTATSHSEWINSKNVYGGRLRGWHLLSNFHSYYIYIKALQFTIATDAKVSTLSVFIQFNCKLDRSSWETLKLGQRKLAPARSVMFVQPAPCSMFVGIPLPESSEAPVGWMLVSQKVPLSEFSPFWWWVAW